MDVCATLAAEFQVRYSLQGNQIKGRTGHLLPSQQEGKVKVGQSSQVYEPKLKHLQENPPPGAGRRGS